MTEFNEIIKDKLTYNIIGCAMKVHSTLGPGLSEVIYQRALAIEFEENNISFEREKSKQVFYKDQNVGSRRADFIVGEKVIVELKARHETSKSDLVQAKNYTIAYNYPLGLLLNFGASSLEYKLLFNPKFHPKPDLK